MENSKTGLLPKPGRPSGDPSSYRQLYMIDTMGKILKRLICNRLEQHLERGAEGLSDNQYGFRRGRSTTDAIKKLTTIAGNANERTRWMHCSKEHCGVIILDVRNALIMQAGRTLRKLCRLYRRQRIL